MVICIWKVFSGGISLLKSSFFPTRWNCGSWSSNESIVCTDSPKRARLSRGWGVPSRTPWLHHCHCFGWRRLQGMGTCVSPIISWQKSFWKTPVSIPDSELLAFLLHESQPATVGHQKGRESSNRKTSESLLNPRRVNFLQNNQGIFVFVFL